MKVFTYSQARQALAAVLDTALKEAVLITRRGGDTFAVTYKTTPKSPFDVPGVKTRATTQDILEAIRESRSRGAEPNHATDGYGDGGMPAWEQGGVAYLAAVFTFDGARQWVFYTDDV